MNYLKTTLLALLNLLSLNILSYAQTGQVNGVPYFYQYNNSINPGGSCQNTSIAMTIKFFGGTTETPDQVSNYYGTSQAQTVSGLETVFNSEAAYYGLTVRDIGHSDGTFSEIHTLLAAGKPVIVHGYFTSYGHVMVITGYNGSVYTCNDPAGIWSEQYQYGGYCQCDANEGHSITYSKNAFENAIGPDGTVWYHEFTNTTIIPPPTTSDLVAPTSAISIANSNSYITNNFTASFNDVDNTGGVGIEKSFYSVLDWNGSEWRANKNNGFFCDNFDSNIHSDWVASSGSWSISNNVLNQTNATSTNASISTLLNQNLSNRYIYHFLGKISGTGTNRSAGVHLFCDDITQSNRGNNYLVLFKADANTVEIYKVVNNVLGTAIKTFANAGITANNWYDYKIMYDRTTGKFTIWKNDILIGSHTDSSSPLFNGSGFSFRSSESNFSINNFKVYRSRQLTNASISIGSANSDVRYQSPDASNVSYACKIKSITVDVASNISAIQNQDLLIDWTPPESISWVNDGSNLDTNYTTSSNIITANFCISNDTNSAINEYLYSIGTSAGATDIVNWTSNGNSINLLANGLTLIDGTTYYVNVKAKNNAGLYSAVASSNGQTYLSSITNINSPFSNNEFSIFPNPASESAILTFENALHKSYSVIIYDAQGLKVSEQELYLTSNTQLNISGLSKGIYNIQVRGNKESFTKKFIKL